MLTCISSGKSRLFGFIGFKTADQASEAAKFFDRTFLDTSRILVEVAKPVRVHDTLPLIHYRWVILTLPDLGALTPKAVLLSAVDSKQKKTAKSLYIPFSSLSNIKAEDIKKRKRGETVDKKPEKVADPQLTEFLEVMKPKSQTKFWSNDDALTATIATEISTESKKPKVEAKVTQVENRRRGGEGIMLKKTHVKFDESESEDELYNEIPNEDVVSFNSWN